MTTTSEAVVRDALKQVIDPELGVNIVDLGLVYRIELSGTHVRIDMTMTSAACPLGDFLKELVESTLNAAVGPVDVDVVFVWDPPWTPDMMSETARELLDRGGI